MGMPIGVAQRKPCGGFETSAAVTVRWLPKTHSPVLWASMAAILPTDHVPRLSCATKRHISCCRSSLSAPILRGGLQLGLSKAISTRCNSIENRIVSLTREINCEFVRDDTVVKIRHPKHTQILLDIMEILVPVHVEQRSVRDSAVPG